MLTAPTETIGLVLHFRTPELTLGCLDSLAREGVAGAVVVDNSEDAGVSLQAMTGGMARLAAAGFPIETVAPGRNLGFAGGVAAGLAHIRAGGHRAVLLINSDATLEPGALVALHGCLAGHGLAIPRVRPKPAAPASTSMLFYHRATGLILRRAWGRACIAVPCGCCQLIHPELATPDLYDGDFFFYCEDIRLGSALAQRAVNVADCAAATVIHAGSASARKGSLFYEYHVARGHWLLAGKLAEGPGEHFTFRLLRALLLPLRAVLRSLRSRSFTPLRALVMAGIDLLRGRCRSLTPPA